MMKLRIFGVLVVSAALGAWLWTFHLAYRWQKHLQVVNNDPYGYWEIPTLPFMVPLAVLAVAGLWFLGPIVGQAIVDWLRK